MSSAASVETGDDDLPQSFISIGLRKPRDQYYSFTATSWQQRGTSITPTESISHNEFIQAFSAKVTDRKPFTKRSTFGNDDQCHDALRKDAKTVAEETAAQTNNSTCVRIMNGDQINNLETGGKYFPLPFTTFSPIG